MRVPPGAAPPTFSTERSLRGAGRGSGSVAAVGFEQQGSEPLAAPAGAHEAFPVRDRQLDRGKGARRENGARDHHARGDLAGHHQICPHRQHARLQQHPGHPRRGAEPAADVGGALLLHEDPPVGLAPDLAEAVGHAHGVDDLGVALPGGDHGAARLQAADDLARRAPGEDLGQHGQDDEQDRADHGGDAEPEVEGEADREVERHPRQVEERGRAAAGEEAADLVEVAQGLLSVAILPGADGAQEDELEDGLAQALVERRADAGQDAAAHDVERGLEAEEHHQDRGEPDEGGDAAARQDPIVDLQHEERAAQVQDVDQRAEHGHADEGPAVHLERYETRGLRHAHPLPTGLFRHHAGRPAPGFSIHCKDGAGRDRVCRSRPAALADPLGEEVAAGAGSYHVGPRAGHAHQGDRVGRR